MNNNIGESPIDKKLNKANKALIKRLTKQPLSLRYDFNDKGELVNNLYEQIFFICFQFLSNKKYKLSFSQQEIIVFSNSEVISKVVDFLENTALQQLNNRNNQTNKGLH